MKVETSTWQQTSNHLKYCSYHTCYPNITFFISLKFKLQGTSTYQVLNFAPKLVKSCATKPKRYCEISLRFQALKSIPTHFHFFQNYHYHPIYSPFFPPSIKTINYSPPKEWCRNKFPQYSIYKLCPKKKAPNDPNSHFKKKEK
jgi:hypothetical protein